MKILIDIGHPAHVHLFKNFAWSMGNRGHKIFFTCREKEFEIFLLKKYGFRFKSFGKKYLSNVGKIWGMIEFDIKEFFIGLEFKPDILLSAGSIYAAHASFLLRKPHIALEDTGNDEQVRLYKPFTKKILTSNSFQKEYGKKQVKYNSYHELAYLHPKYFIPNDSIFKLLGLDKNTNYSIIRFVSWNATHDHSVSSGLTNEIKIKIVDELSKYSRVFISAEGDIPKVIEKYAINIPPDRMHDALYYASLLFGESGTMTSECAMLGVPAIQISGLPKGTMGVLKEQEEYGLIKVYEKYSQKILKEAIDWIINKRKNITRKLAEEMINEKDNLTDYLIHYIDNKKYML